jgi:hypothetical protein
MNLEFENVLKRTMNQNPHPGNFLKELSVAIYAEEVSLDPNSFLQKIIELIEQVDPNNLVKQLMQRWLIQCDGVRESDWQNQTESNTKERRELIYDYLELAERERQILQEKVPPRTHGNPIIAIEHSHWYTSERKAEGHYAPSLINYLSKRGWTSQNIGLIDEASDDIIGNLADPKWALDPDKQNSAFACRGLVVGYVQSGKTTTINLTAAKAVDAGYRLIIVMSGLTNLLRRQTQRRMDKEVVGKYFLENDLEFETPDGYCSAPDWNDFIEHPEPRPGSLVRDIERLTTLKFDFSSARGAAALSDSWVNAESSSKIIVIKKVKGRLENLNRELARLGKNERNKLSVLILDDESDQASINTQDPNKPPPKNKKSGLKKKSDNRTAINFEIVKILRLLPRAQYVGVTATPVANCFVDPKDANDLYPRSFILPLSRPEGYMGILDFHDLNDDLEPISENEPRPKLNQHIRAIGNIRGADDSELMNAIDAWVLAGALKLYRMTTGVYQGRHHTFFYSDSTEKDSHKLARDRILALWPKLGYLAASGWTRLELSYRSELLANSEHQGNLDYFPAHFENLKSFVTQALQKIDTQFEEHEIVLIVNSSEYAANIDFDLQEIWKIVVGGAKLSRGYTIEGLTVTYFRRKSNNEAALMQMGRWFGYREGYRDLVRLWISRKEPAKPEPLDIYSKYQAVCIDEEKLRRRFTEWYSSPLPDGSKITPLMVRPLIEQFDSSLLPVAKNQMWNVELVSKVFQGLHTNVRMSKKDSDINLNAKLFTELFLKYPLTPGVYYDKAKMYYTLASAIDISELVNSFARPSLKNHNSEETLFGKFLKSGDCRIRDWLVFLPQLSNSNSNSNENGKWNVSHNLSVSTFSRSWRDESGEIINTIGESRERIAARMVSRTTQSNDVTVSDLEKVSELMKNMAIESGRAVMVLRPYFIKDRPCEGNPYMGYELFLPPNNGGYAFRTKHTDGLPLQDHGN